MELVYMHGGPSKSSSGEVSVNFGQNGIHIEIGCYDLGSLPRHHSLGVFPTEAEALKALADFVAEVKSWPVDKCDECGDQGGFEGHPDTECPVCGRLG
jgi:hypothetical protein